MVQEPLRPHQRPPWLKKFHPSTKPSFIWFSIACEGFETIYQKTGKKCDEYLLRQMKPVIIIAREFFINWSSWLRFSFRLLLRTGNRLTRRLCTCNLINGYQEDFESWSEVVCVNKLVSNQVRSCHTISGISLSEADWYGKCFSWIKKIYVQNSAADSKACYLQIHYWHWRGFLHLHSSYKYR